MKWIIILLVPLFTPTECEHVDIIDYTGLMITDAFNGSYLQQVSPRKRLQDYWPFLSLELPSADVTTICFSLKFWTIDWRPNTLLAVKNSTGGFVIIIDTGYVYSNRTYQAGKGFQGKFFFDHGVFGGIKKNFNTPIFTYLPDWKFMCVEVDMVEKSVALSYDGNVIFKEYGDNMILEISKIEIVNEAVSVLNIYDKKIEKIECGEKGNLYTWNPSAFIKNLNTTTTMDKKILCNKDEPYKITIPVKADYDTSLSTCKKMGNGRFPRFETKLDSDTFWINAKKETGILTGTMYAPFKKFPSGKYLYTEDPTIELDDSFWLLNQPNEEDGYCVNCAETGCADKKCDAKYYSVCEFENGPVLKLRGLCEDTDMDLFYYPATQLKEILWIGARRTFIRYNMTENKWIARIHGSETWATSEASYESLLMGTSQWTMYNDRKCKPVDLYSTRLSLSSCSSLDFNCDDGTCIELKNRCDGRMDCTDGSDEDNCRKLKEPEKYNNYIVSRKAGRQDADLYVSVIVTNILDIQEDIGLIRISVKIHMAWHDDRLVFLDLKNTSINRLTPAEYNVIWRPILIIPNMEETDNNPIRPKITVEHNRTAGLTDFTYIYNAFTFPGSTSSLQLTAEIRPNFLCTFNLNNYPFDVQVCEIRMTLDDTQLLTVKMIPKTIDFHGETSVLQYNVESYILCAEEFESNQYIIAKITIRRGLLDAFLTECLPTIIANFIGHLTNFFYEKDFDAASHVNLTILLVLTTMFIGTANNLPQSSSIKFVEVWMLFSLLFPFVETILQTYAYTLKNRLAEGKVEEQEGGGFFSSCLCKKTESEDEATAEKNDRKIMFMDYVEKDAREKKSMKKIEKVNFILRRIKPAIYFIFIAGYWIIGVLVLLLEDKGNSCKKNINR